MMNPEELLHDWKRRAQESQFGHFEAAKHFSRQHYWIGIPVVALSAIVGTSMFATIQNEASDSVQIGIGLLSVGAAVLASLQTFLGSPGKAENHRTAAALYGAVRREIDQTISVGAVNGTEGDKILRALRLRLDELAFQVPEISPRVWKRTEKELARYSEPKSV